MSIGFCLQNLCRLFCQKNPVNFTANLTKAHSDNAYLQLVSQTIAASSAQPIDSCNIGNGPSTFTMNGVTDLMTNSTVSGGVSKSMLKKSRLNFDKIEKCK